MNRAPTTLVRRTAVATFAALVLVACGGSTRDTTTPDPSNASSTTPAPASSSAATESVLPAALVGATTVDGEPFDASALAGRPTVAWFWAPWCVICRGEAPDVAAVAESYAGRVNFVGVAGLGPTEDMRQFVADTGVGGFAHVDDADGTIWSSYEVYAQPAYAFITDDGRVEIYSGALGAEGLTEIVELLLAA